MGLVLEVGDNISHKSYKLKCEFCNSININIKYQIKNDNIFECKNCGILFSSFNKKKSQKIYSENYYLSNNRKDGYNDYNGMYKSHKSTFLKRLEFIENNYKKEGLVFDFGCALGHFCEVAKEKNWIVIGSDLATYAAKYTKNKYDINTFICDITHPPVTNNIADLICLYDLIEHIPHPKKSLLALKNILKNDGILHIVTPDSNSFSAKILGARWFHYKPQEHLFYFNKHNLTNLLRQTGFEVLKVYSNFSYMALDDIFIRLSFYLGPISKFIIYILSLFNMKKVVVPIYVGNFEIIAKPKYFSKSELKNSLSPKLINFDEIFNCLNCDHGLKIESEKIIKCNNCLIEYVIDDGVPNFII